MLQMWGFVLYLFLTVGGAAGQGVEQPAKLMSVEGTFARVNCTYSTSGFNGLSWYQQREGQAPVFLSYVVLDGLKDSGHFSTFLSRSNGYSYLLLTELQIKDSASYLCAVRDTVTVLTSAAAQKF